MGKKQARVMGPMLAAAVIALAAATPASAAALKRCPLPQAGQPMHTATPAEVGLDSDAVGKAMTYASMHNRLSVRIIRNGCLVTKGTLDSITEKIPWEIFSSTKAVVSLLAGIAIDHGKLHLNDRLGEFLPDGVGDAVHRSITVRDLLTETAGLSQSILSEFVPVGSEPDVVRQAMALPMEHKPGTYFNYTQRVPDLLAYVVQKAVGMDLQEFAQKELFGPVGIERDSWFWLRDRSGNTYGYANLFIPPLEFSKLGALMANDGRWRGHQVISLDYIKQLREPSATNPCYGFLFWVNRGRKCTTASIPSRRVLDHRFVPSAPRGMYAMVGAFQQNNFIVPSLDMVVTWTGLGGDAAPDPQAILSANPGADLYNNTFRLLMRGVRDRHVKDRGAYPAEEPNLNFDPLQFIDPRILIGSFGVGPYGPPDCTVLACAGEDLTAGPRQELRDVIRAIGAAIAG